MRARAERFNDNTLAGAADVRKTLLVDRAISRNLDNGLASVRAAGAAEAPQFEAILAFAAFPIGAALQAI